MISVGRADIKRRIRRIQDRTVGWIGVVAFGVVPATGSQFAHAWAGPGPMLLN